MQGHSVYSSISCCCCFFFLVIDSIIFSLINRISFSYLLHLQSSILLYSGTLLGAYRMGDILPYDHDADISYILETEKPEAFRELRELGMQANGLVAVLGDVTVDFMRWQPVNVSSYISGKTETMLRKYYPPSSKDNLILKYHHTLETSPMSWVVPFKRFYFQEVNVALPNSRDKLRIRSERVDFSFLISVNAGCPVI